MPPLSNFVFPDTQDSPKPLLPEGRLLAAVAIAGSPKVFRENKGLFVCFRGD